MTPLPPQFVDRLRVLLVDDDPVQQKLDRLLLEQAGFAVDTAPSAEDALRRVEQCAPDAVLSDVAMPSLDGFSLCRRLRERTALAHLPVVLHSAGCAPADRQRAVLADADALVERTGDLRAEVAALWRGLARRARSARPPREILDTPPEDLPLPPATGPDR